MTSLRTKISLAVVSAIFSVPANAADILDSKYDPAPVGIAVNWTGVYIGGQLGYGNANHNLKENQYFKDYCGDEGDVGQSFEDSFLDGDRGGRERDLVDGVLVCPENGDGEGQRPYDNTLVPGQSRQISNVDGYNSHGIIGGFKAGYDLQVNPDWVLGIGGSFNLSNMETTETYIDGDSYKIEKGNEWTLFARAGHLLSQRTMLYGLVGYTGTDYDFTFSDSEDSETVNVDFNGLTIGAGLEHALTPAVFIGIEGTHTFYSEETVYDYYDVEENYGESLKDELDETRVMGTLTFKIN